MERKMFLLVDET